MLPFPKPKDAKKSKPEAIRVFRDGREVCNMNCKAGRDEYTHRVDQMFEWQDKRCGLMTAPQCKAKQGRWPREMMQFGHGSSRGHGSGKRDDRIRNADGTRTNARALCPWCNSLQGSRPITDFEEFIP